MYAKNYHSAVSLALAEAKSTQVPMTVYWSNGTWNVSALKDRAWSLFIRIAWPNGKFETNAVLP
jgi:hypothetical protein